MAIEPAAAQIIEQIANVFKTMPADAFERNVLCLGYPDVLHVGNTQAAGAKDEAQIAAWHRWKGRVLDADAWFASLDLKPEYWDVVASRGPERIVNFNEIVVQDGYARLPARLTMDFEEPEPESSIALLIDPGTIEHVFCASNVFALICRLVAINGYVLHTTPLSLGNHGMWSIHPTAFTDFYEANGFKVEILAELSGPLENRVVRQVPPTKRFKMIPEATMFCLARREKSVPLTWPVQSKYRANPMLKANVSRETMGAAS